MSRVPNISATFEVGPEGSLDELLINDVLTAMSKIVTYQLSQRLVEWIDPLEYEISVGFRTKSHVNRLIDMNMKYRGRRRVPISIESINIRETNFRHDYAQNEVVLFVMREEGEFSYLTKTKRPEHGSHMFSIFDVALLDSEALSNTRQKVITLIHNALRRISSHLSLSEKRLDAAILAVRDMPYFLSQEIGDMVSIRANETLEAQLWGHWYPGYFRYDAQIFLDGVEASNVPFLLHWKLVGPGLFNPKRGGGQLAWLDKETLKFSPANEEDSCLIFKWNGETIIEDTPPHFGMLRSLDSFRTQYGDFGKNVRLNF